VSASAPPGRGDPEVVAAVLAGDGQAYGELMRRHGPSLYRMLYRMVGDGPTAEDLTQEALVRAYYALPTYDPQYRFSTWLYQIASHLCINHWRKRCREQPVGRDAAAADHFFESLPDPDRLSAPADVAAATDLRERLAAAVMALPDNFREVLVMRHMMELSYQEICDATGLPMGTVKSRLDRARRQLGESLRVGEEG
jgi:RNA polymerase sigma-70 factor (ECF subfamily)